MCEKEEMPKAKTVPPFSTLIQDSSELYAVNYFFPHTLILESPSKHPFILKTLLLKKKKKKFLIPLPLKVFFLLFINNIPPKLSALSHLSASIWLFIFTHLL